jgi:hypothetical protein
MLAANWYYIFAADETNEYQGTHDASGAWFVEPAAINPLVTYLLPFVDATPDHSLLKPPERRQRPTSGTESANWPQPGR